MLAPRKGEQCRKSGLEISPVFERPFEVALCTRGAPDYQPKKVAPYEDPGVQHLEIDCPSGEMIIADWIRINELSDLVKANQDWSEEFSINHAAGKIRDTKRTLEKFGLLDLHLSNMAVKMYKSNGILLIGDAYNEEIDDDKIPLDCEPVGSVCTDRWSLTAIDRAVLEKVLSEVSDNPKALVDSYLAENRYGVSVQQWTPGKHHIYFSGDYSCFQKEFSSPDLGLPEEMAVYAVISDRPLELTSITAPAVQTKRKFN